MNWIVVGGVHLTPVTLLVLLALGAGLLLWLDGRRTVAPTTAARRAVRHATITEGVAVALAVVPAILYPIAASFLGAPMVVEPRWLAVAPSIGLWAFLGIHAVGELTWPGPRRAHREARLVARTTSDVVSRAARWGTYALVIALAITAGALALAADGPRTIARIDGGSMVHEGSFPGWWWTLPVFVATLVTAALTEVVLRLVALRPAVEDVDGRWDMWLRRRAARRILRVVHLVLGLTLAGLLGLAGLSLRWVASADIGVDGVLEPSAPGYIAVGNVLFWIAVAVVLASIAVTAWPARDPLPDRSDDPATDHAPTEAPA
ncbi:hypothetical protein GCM10009809_20350 [Isoptericola hypogeus]|uniref:Uncharacterized protein n=1 Tax=Isoptericola hypogeus TaxID=300179 RepID=A0ABN2JET0_9MICO